MSLLLLGILNSQAAAGGAGAYDLLETTTLGSDSASVVFSNLTTTYGSTYKHLQFRISAYATGSTLAPTSMQVRFNNDSTSGSHRSHQLKGDGSSVISRTLSQDQGYLRDALADGDTLAQASPVIMDILDFADTNKAIVAKAFSGATQQFGSAVSLESLLLTTGATALTQVSFNRLSTNTYGAGSRFSLYGIKGA